MLNALLLSLNLIGVGLALLSYILFLGIIRNAVGELVIKTLAMIMIGGFLLFFALAFPAIIGIELSYLVSLYLATLYISYVAYGMVFAIPLRVIVRMNRLSVEKLSEGYRRYIAALTVLEDMYS